MTDAGRRLLFGLLAAATMGAPACSADAPSARPTTVPEITTVTTTTTAPARADLAEAVRQWKDRAGDHFTESAKALEQVSEASAAGDEAALRSGCLRLHDTNTVGLQRDLPSPDPRLTDALQRMIDDINTATHACMRFVLNRDEVDAANYREYLARAVEHLHRAKEFMDADLAPK